MPHATTTFNFTHFLPHDVISFTGYLPLFLFDICNFTPSLNYAILQNSYFISTYY